MEKRTKNKKVIVAMSGGVDSSLTAALLLEKGYEVVGITMKLMEREVIEADSCCGLEAVEDARQVAGKLGISHYVLNFQEEFGRDVIEYFCREYAQGRTPNPCVLCNSKLKFGKLMEKSREFEADFIATGHYARVVYDRERNRFILKRGKDKNKDQSYFLFNLNQAQLSRIIFPLGELEKSEVREKARKLGLKVHNRRESQEICFVPDDDYGGFLRKKIPEIMKPGKIIDKQGNVLGRHEGTYLFTIGQRRGLGIAAGEPLYVISIDHEQGVIVVGGERDVYRSELIAQDINWITCDGVSEPLQVTAQVRYRHAPAEASIVPIQGSKDIKVIFKSPQLAVTPGQAVVFYHGDEVIGGGWIDIGIRNMII